MLTLIQIQKHQPNGSTFQLDQWLAEIQ